MKKQNLSFFLIFYAGALFAQQQLGMRTETRSGIYATSINPAALSFTPSRWEFSLANTDVFLNQNYGYIANGSVPEVLRNPELVQLADDIAGDPSANGQLPVDFYTRGKVFGVMQGRIGGPALALRLNTRHSVGLSIATRFSLSSYRVPALLRYNQISQLEYGTTYEVAPVKVNAMAWNEIAGHYAYRNFDGDVLFSIGATPKFLMGYQGAYGRVNANFEYTPISKDTASINTANWNFGYTNDIVYADDPAAYRPKANGYGAGIDLGVSWAMPIEDAKHAEDYLWRAGVSITDLGWIRFGKNAETHQIGFNNLQIVAGDSLQAAADNNPEAAVQALSNTLLGSPTQSRTGSDFTLGLPTLLSAQFDYALTRQIYVQGIWSQRLPLSRNTLRAPSTVAIIPRWEHQWFSVSMPVVLSDYRSARMGLGLRLGVLYIGSDDIGSWTGKRELTGPDFYAGIKINGFQIGKQGGHRKRKHHQGGFFKGGLRERDRHWKDVGCFNQ